MACSFGIFWFAISTAFVVWNVCTYERHGSNYSYYTHSKDFILLFTLFCNIMSLCVGLLIYFSSVVNDNFGIGEELAWILLFHILKQLLYYTLRDFVPPDFWPPSNADSVKYFCMYLSRVLCDILTLFVIVFVISWALLKDRRNLNLTLRKPSIIERETTIEEVLNSEEAYREFEGHLQKEFALENLNFIVQVIMFRRLLTKIKIRRATPDPKKFEEILGIRTRDLCDGGPGKGDGKMELVVGDTAPKIRWLKSIFTESHDCEERARFIYSEFCKRGAPQEINCGNAVQKSLRKFFEGQAYIALDCPSGLSDVFDAAFNKIMALLSDDSLRRFKNEMLA